MPNILGMIGQAATGPLLNTALGLGLEKHNDQRQLEQQGKLGMQQLGFNIQQMQAGQDMQYEQWKRTNHPAQLAMLKEAGLSPGLYYGGSGAGGSAQMGSSQGNSTGGQAPKGGGEIMGLQLMGAQKNLLEAEARKADAQADKTRGVDTELAQVTTDIKKIEQNLLTDSYIDTLNKVEAESMKLTAEARKASIEGQIMHETEFVEIAKKEGELLGIGLANELKREGIKLNQAQTKAMIASISQKWTSLGIKKGELELKKFVNDVAQSTRLTVETASKLVDTLMKGGFSARQAHWKNATEIEKAVIKQQK